MQPRALKTAPASPGEERGCRRHGRQGQDVRPREPALADALKFKRCPDADNNNERKHPDEELARAAACARLEAAVILRSSEVAASGAPVVVLASATSPQNKQGCDERRQPDREGRENDVNAAGEREPQGREQHGGHQEILAARSRAAAHSRRFGRRRNGLW
jgi:hypothetical protein